MTRAVVAAGMAALLALGPAVAGAQETAPGAADAACGPKAPPIPAFPDPPPPPLHPPEYRPLHGMGTDVPLGVGAVGPAETGPPGEAWLSSVRLPVYESLGGPLAGYVTRGHWAPVEGRARPLTTEALVETGYETASWIALATAPGGWLRVRFLPAGTDGVGVAGWVSVCHLAASPIPLAFTPWEARLSGPGPLFFRTTNAHALRTGPGADRERRFWIRGNDHDAMLEPLEVRGDWMRVRVTRPSTYCVSDPPPDVRVDEGWIRWRDDEMGPWVWTFTRGC